LGPHLGGVSRCPVIRPEKATGLQHCIREFLFKRKVDIGQTDLLGIVVTFF